MSQNDIILSSFSNLEKSLEDKKKLLDTQDQLLEEKDLQISLLTSKLQEIDNKWIPHCQFLLSNVEIEDLLSYDELYMKFLELHSENTDLLQFKEASLQSLMEKDSQINEITKKLTDTYLLFDQTQFEIQLERNSLMIMGDRIKNEEIAQLQEKKSFEGEIDRKVEWKLNEYLKIEKIRENDLHSALEKCGEEIESLKNKLETQEKQYITKEKGYKKDIDIYEKRIDALEAKIGVDPEDMMKLSNKFTKELECLQREIHENKAIYYKEIQIIENERIKCIKQLETYQMDIKILEETKLFLQSQIESQQKELNTKEVLIEELKTDFQSQMRELKEKKDLELTALDLKYKKLKLEDDIYRRKSSIMMKPLINELGSMVQNSNKFNFFDRIAQEIQESSNEGDSDDEEIERLEEELVEAVTKVSDLKEENKSLKMEIEEKNEVLNEKIKFLEDLNGRLEGIEGVNIEISIENSGLKSELTDIKEKMALKKVEIEETILKENNGLKEVISEIDMKISGFNELLREKQGIIEALNKEISILNDFRIEIDTKTKTKTEEIEKENLFLKKEINCFKNQEESLKSEITLNKKENLELTFKIDMLNKEITSLKSMNTEILMIIENLYINLLSIENQLEITEKHNKSIIIELNNFKKLIIFYEKQLKEVFNEIPVFTKENLLLNESQSFILSQINEIKEEKVLSGLDLKKEMGKIAIIKEKLSILKENSLLTPLNLQIETISFDLKKENYLLKVDSFLNNRIKEEALTLLQAFTKDIEDKPAYPDENPFLSQAKEILKNPLNITISDYEIIFIQLKEEINALKAILLESKGKIVYFEETLKEYNEKISCLEQNISLKDNNTLKTLENELFHLELDKINLIPIDKMIEAQNRMKILENGLSCKENQLKGLEKQIKEAFEQEALKGLEGDVIKLVSKLKRELEFLQKDFKEDIEGRNKVINEKNIQLEGLIDRINHQQAELGEYKEKIECLEVNIVEKQKENEIYKEKLVKSKDVELKSLKEEIKARIEENIELNGIIKEKDVKINEFICKNKDIVREMEENRLKNKELGKEINEITVKNKEITNENKDIHLKNKDNTEKIIELMNKNKENTEQNSKLSYQNSEVTQLNHELTLQNKELNLKTDELTYKTNELTHKNIENSLKLDQNQSIITELTHKLSQTQSLSDKEKETFKTILLEKESLITQISEEKEAILINLWEKDQYKDIIIQQNELLKSKLRDLEQKEGISQRKTEDYLHIKEKNTCLEARLKEITAFFNEFHLLYRDLSSTKKQRNIAFEKIAFILPMKEQKRLLVKKKQENITYFEGFRFKNKGNLQRSKSDTRDNNLNLDDFLCNYIEIRKNYENLNKNIRKSIEILISEETSQIEQNEAIYILNKAISSNSFEKSLYFNEKLLYHHFSSYKSLLRAINSLKDSQITLLIDKKALKRTIRGFKQKMVFFANTLTIAQNNINLTEISLSQKESQLKELKSIEKMLKIKEGGILKENIKLKEEIVSLKEDLERIKEWFKDSLTLKDKKIKEIKELNTVLNENNAIIKGNNEDIKIFNEELMKKNESFKNITKENEELLKNNENLKQKTAELTQINHKNIQITKQNKELAQKNESFLKINEKLLISTQNPSKTLDKLLLKFEQNQESLYKSLISEITLFQTQENPYKKLLKQKLQTHEKSLYNCQKELETLNNELSFENLNFSMLKTRLKAFIKGFIDLQTENKLIRGFLKENSGYIEAFKDKTLLDITGFLAQKEENYKTELFAFKKALFDIISHSNTKEIDYLSTETTNIPNKPNINHIQTLTCETEPLMEEDSFRNSPVITKKTIKIPFITKKAINIPIISERSNETPIITERNGKIPIIRIEDTNKTAIISQLNVIKAAYEALNKTYNEEIARNSLYKQQNTVFYNEILDKIQLFSHKVKNISSFIQTPFKSPFKPSFQKPDSEFKGQIMEFLTNISFIEEDLQNTLKKAKISLYNTIETHNSNHKTLYKSQENPYESPLESPKPVITLSNPPTFTLKSKSPSFYANNEYYKGIIKTNHHKRTSTCGFHEKNLLKSRRTPALSLTEENFMNILKKSGPKTPISSFSLEFESLEKNYQENSLWVRNLNENNKDLKEKLLKWENFKGALVPLLKSPKEPMFFDIYKGFTEEQQGIIIEIKGLLKSKEGFLEEGLFQRNLEEGLLQKGFIDEKKNVIGTFNGNFGSLARKTLSFYREKGNLQKKQREIVNFQKSSFETVNYDSFQRNSLSSIDKWVQKNEDIGLKGIKEELFRLKRREIELNDIIKGFEREKLLYEGKLRDLEIKNIKKTGFYQKVQLKQQNPLIKELEEGLKTKEIEINGWKKRCMELNVKYKEIMMFFELKNESNEINQGYLKDKEKIERLTRKISLQDQNLHTSRLKSIEERVTLQKVIKGLKDEIIEKNTTNLLKRIEKPKNTL